MMATAKIHIIDFICNTYITAKIELEWIEFHAKEVESDICEDIKSPMPNLRPRPVFVPRLSPMPTVPSSEDPLYCAAAAGAIARTATTRRIRTFFFIKFPSKLLIKLSISLKTLSNIHGVSKPKS